LLGVVRGVIPQIPKGTRECGKPRWRPCHGLTVGVPETDNRTSDHRHERTSAVPSVS
jgi:hypothetical protein